MFDKFIIILFFILIRKFLTNGQHEIVKRMELETCLGQFDIHRNMIIRTEESLSIGGKYLQGISLDSEIECRRLCCETENCDVFIFEEKSEAYCYLFNCGPPENFRCKFTKHSNFTSAVLTPVLTPVILYNATVKPLTQQQPAQIHPIISKQELELTNLKQKLDLNNKEKLGTTVATLSQQPVPTLTTAKTTLATISNCGRFQFKCHSGECIGIYNACNGIPQCEDGSDEGPECSNTGFKSSAQSNNGDLSNNMLNRISNERMTIKNNIQSMPRQYQPQMLQPINNREDPMSAPVPVIWPNHQIPELQSNLDQNRIFNHKGGIQIPQNMQPNIYMQQAPNPYSNVLLKPDDHMMISPNINWDPQTMQQLQQQIMPLSNNPYAMPPQLQSPTGIKITQEAIENSPIVAKSEQVNGADQQKQKDETMMASEIAKESSDEYTESEEYTEAPKKKQRKHKKAKELKTKAKQIKEPVETPYHEEYRMEFMDHDGYSERPSGAIISLVLGIFITACLAVLLGCKMRTVGRRRVSTKSPSFNEKYPSLNS